MSIDLSLIDIFTAVVVVRSHRVHRDQLRDQGLRNISFFDLELETDYGTLKTIDETSLLWKLRLLGITLLVSLGVFIQGSLLFGTPWGECSYVWIIFPQRRPTMYRLNSVLPLLCHSLLVNGWL